MDAKKQSGRKTKGTVRMSATKLSRQELDEMSSSMIAPLQKQDKNTDGR
jgi:hypothetical protein